MYLSALSIIGNALYKCYTLLLDCDRLFLARSIKMSLQPDVSEKHKILCPASYIHYGLCLFVCLSVCSRATCHSFWHMDLIFFLAQGFLGENPQTFFSSFWYVNFGRFSIFFLFILSNSSVRATSRYDRLTNFTFDTESLYDTFTWGFQRFLKICMSAPFRGPFIFKKGPKSQKT